MAKYLHEIELLKDLSVQIVLCNTLREGSKIVLQKFLWVQIILKLTWTF